MNLLAMQETQKKNPVDREAWQAAAERTAHAHYRAGGVSVVSLLESLLVSLCG